MEAEFNQTLEKFNYPHTLIAEYDHWVLLLRPRQLTFGSCVIAAKADVTSIGDLPAGAGDEYIKIVKSFETAMRKRFNATKFNYIALMMVDPNPHFHAIPRYDAPVMFNGTDYNDTLYPKPPDLNDVLGITDETRTALQDELKQMMGGSK